MTETGQETSEAADREHEAADQVKQDDAARASGSAKDDITPETHPVRDAIGDLIPGDSGSDGH